MNTQPLKGITVLEMAGLAPVPFAGMLLSDFGANVIRIDRLDSNIFDPLIRNKRSIAIDLKHEKTIEIILKLCEKSDVLLDSFRPGVMESLGLGPDVVFKINPRLVYARISGYGQSGIRLAGHDINFLATSGALNMMGRQGEVPFPPSFVSGSFSAGSSLCVIGILMALLERVTSGKGQVVDSSISSGAAYLATFPFLMKKYNITWTGERGTNILDGGAHFYNTYKTKDNLYMAIGALEPKFYANLLYGLGLNKDEYMLKQNVETEWILMKKLFQDIFIQKTQDEWTTIFKNLDACVTPVLPFETNVPQPVPVLSKTPAHTVNNSDKNGFLQPGKHTIEVLKEFGISSDEIQRLLSLNVLKNSSSL